MAAKYRKLLIGIGAISGILSCLVDVVSSTVLGSQIEGYDHLRSPLSQLGISSSPVASEIALWWEIVGILMILFGISIYVAFRDKGKNALIASMLLILYGIGEGLGSGLFPADKAGTIHSDTGIFHILIGGMGVVGLAHFPLIMRNLMPGLKKVSMIIFIFGFIGVSLFLLSPLIDEPLNFIAEYKGLWQRLFITNYYFYLVVVASKLIYFAINEASGG
jgi:hypothetical protein